MNIKTNAVNLLFVSVFSFLGGITYQFLAGNNKDVFANAEKKDEIPQSIEARQFIIVDKDGNKCGSFRALHGSSALILRNPGTTESIVIGTSGKDHDAGIVISHGKTKSELRLVVGEKVSGMFLRNASGKSTLLVGNAEGCSRIMLKPAKGKSSILIGYEDKKGIPIIRLRESEKISRIQIGLTENRYPIILLQDKSGKGRVLIGVKRDQVPVILTLDDKGKTVWEAPTKKNN